MLNARLFVPFVLVTSIACSVYDPPCSTGSCGDVGRTSSSTEVGAGGAGGRAGVGGSGGSLDVDAGLGDAASDDAGDGGGDMCCPSGKPCCSDFGPPGSGGVHTHIPAVMLSTAARSRSCGAA